MATPPNNYFATNVVTIPDQVSTPVGAPNVITLDYFAEGISEYTLSCAQFTSYLTYVIVVGPTTGSGVTIYLPSTSNLLGQTVVIKNACADILKVDTVSGVTLDEGDYANITLDPPGSPGNRGSVTVVANPTNTDSWYVTDVFIQL